VKGKEDLTYSRREGEVCRKKEKGGALNFYSSVGRKRFTTWSESEKRERL